MPIFYHLDHLGFMGAGDEGTASGGQAVAVAVATVVVIVVIAVPVEEAQVYLVLQSVVLPSLDRLKELRSELFR